MDVQNGDVIAAVSSPSFDPNLFVRGISNTDFRFLMDHDHRPMANKAVQGAYPPGSTFKMVTALAALEEGMITPETTFRCPGYLESGGRKFHCWRHGGHGTVDLERSLSESCDVYYYEVALKVGIDKIAEMGRRLGLGMRHDLPMSAIAEGNMPDKAWKMERHKAEWRIGDTVNASIGQGYVLASPLQLAVMTARLATGRAVNPRLVRAIEGREIPVEPAEPLGLSTSNLTAVLGGMDAVMNGKSGTARSSRVVAEDMRMAGKTGTAQVRNISAAERASGVISNDQLPWNRRDHALFVGYAPYEAPRYAVSVVVEHGGGGSTAAAPIARDVILRALYGETPPVEAYPSSQRGRIETMLKGLKLRLPDGSALHLDTATRLNARLYRQRREVMLIEGQARFEVQADARRPFHVLAGGARITVVGTRFAVRYTPGMAGYDGVRVAVEEGRVQVAVHGAAPVLLTAAQAACSKLKAAGFDCSVVSG